MISSSPEQSERDHYDAFFTGSEAQALDQGTGFQLLRRIQADFLRQKILFPGAIGSILSVGCGNGEIEMHLANSHWRLFAFDLSFAGPALGSRRTARRNTTCLSFGQASLTELPIASHSCDVVLALSVLHHLRPPERPKALAEIYRVLGKNGRFIAYDPSKWRIVRLGKFLVRGKFDALHSPDEEELCPRQMHRLAQAVGFERVQIEFFDMFIDPLVWLLPNMHPGLFRLLYKLDRAMMRFPWKRLASNFFLIGHKAES